MKFNVHLIAALLMSTLFTNFAKAEQVSVKISENCAAEKDPCISYDELNRNKVSLSRGHYTITTLGFLFGIVGLFMPPTRTTQYEYSYQIPIFLTLTGWTFFAKSVYCIYTLTDEAVADFVWKVKKKWQRS